MDLSSTKFVHAIPYAIFPASPALAARHAVRARMLDPEHPGSADSPFCSRCGSHLVQRTTTFTRKRNPSARIHRRSCRICHSTTNTPLPRSSCPPSRKQGATQSPLNTIVVPVAETTQSPPTPPSSDQPKTPVAKSRPKKKSGLQQLLARNREKEEKERQKQNTINSQIGGLSAFLSDL